MPSKSKSNPTHQSKSSKPSSKSRTSSKPIQTEFEIRQKRLTRLFNQLESGFNLNSLKTINQLLVQTPNDLLLKETKAKILVSLDRHQETLDWLMEEDLPPHIQLVRCYCLYKTSSPENAWQTLSKLSQRLDLTPFAERTKKTLEAQILFKLERYEEAKELYEDLLLDSDETHPEHLDLTSNLIQTQARLDFETIQAPTLISSLDLNQLESIPITTSFFNAHPAFPPTPIPIAQPDEPTSDPISTQKPTSSRKPKPKKTLEKTQGSMVIDPPSKPAKTARTSGKKR